MNQSDVVRTWGDTGTVDDMRRSGRPKATTAVDDLYYGFQLEGTLKTTTPC